MRPCRMVLASLMLFVVAAPAWPILIVSGKQRIGGFLEKEDAKHGQHTPDHPSSSRPREGLAAGVCLYPYQGCHLSVAPS